VWKGKHENLIKWKIALALVHRWINNHSFIWCYLAGLTKYRTVESSAPVRFLEGFKIFASLNRAFLFFLSLNSLFYLFDYFLLTIFCFAVFNYDVFCFRWNRFSLFFVVEVIFSLFSVSLFLFSRYTCGTVIT